MVSPNSRGVRDGSLLLDQRYGTEKASFSLSAERGRDGYVARKKLASDRDPEFRKNFSFDLFVSHDPAAVNDLIHMAETDREVSVRERAIFWVGQKAVAKAVAMLKETVQNDPEVAVKKKAVFALSPVAVQANPQQRGV